MSLTLWTVACGAIRPRRKRPGTRRRAPGPEASAIHGRPGAQVALLQSRYLPKVQL